MRILKSAMAAAIAVAGVCSAGQASAAVTIPVPLTASQGLYKGHFGATVAGSFTDGFTFSIPTTGAASTFTLTSSSATASSVIAGLSGYLDTAANPFTVVQFGSSPYTFDLGRLTKGSLTKGAHKLVISGRTGLAGISGTITIAAAAVPEPASWAMMIGGIGLVGGAMRRAHRRSEDRFTARVRAAAA